MSDDKDKKGPWGSNDSGKKGKGPSSNSPWGQGKNHGGKRHDGPDMDDIFRQAQEQFQGFFGGGGNRGHGRGGPEAMELPIGKIILVAIVLYFLTGFYRILPEEHGVILTFGKYTKTQETPGLGYHIPWPIQSLEKVNVTFERRIEVGFRDVAPRRGRNTGLAGGSDIPDESLMLTGDENIIDIDFVVMWRISDAGNFLFEIRNPENTIKKVAESAMREVIGRTKIQQALTEGRSLIEQDTKALMQQMLDDYQSGIAINDVQLQQVDPPSQVVDAFDDVQRARADKERLRNEAEAYRNNIVPRARGEAEKLIQEAEAYKETVVNGAEGEAERFTSVYKSYTKAKDITKERIYLETLEKIFADTNKIIIDGGENGLGGVLPYLPLNQIKPAAGEKDTQ